MEQHNLTVWKLNRIVMSIGVIHIGLTEAGYSVRDFRLSDAYR